MNRTTTLVIDTGFETRVGHGYRYGLRFIYLHNTRTCTMGQRVSDVGSSARQLLVSSSAARWLVGCSLARWLLVSSSARQLLISSSARRLLVSSLAARQLVGSPARRLASSSARQLVSSPARRLASCSSASRWWRWPAWIFLPVFCWPY